jgi:predicted enzyme related to lactoylglutathione lyase
MNLERSVHYYAAVLGNDGRRVSAGRHYFQAGAVVINVVDPRADGDFGQEARPNPDHIYFAVPDLEDTYERARDAGGQWLESRIQTWPWGERCFFARDPSGNPVCFVDEATVYTGD